jgi:hypothetical protein
MPHVLASLAVAIVSTFLATQVFVHDFGDRISLEDQKLFSQNYVRTVHERERVMFVFDCRNVEHIDPPAIWEHIRVFRALRELNRQKVAGFSVLMRSEMLRTVLSMVFRIVPPSAPFVVAGNMPDALTHVCRCLHAEAKLSPDSSERQLRF